jgi:hypothetical protein
MADVLDELDEGWFEVGRPRRWLPVGPLVAAAGGSVAEAARRLGVPSGRLRRPLTAWEADEWAVRVGLHPVEVWGDLFLLQCGQEGDT